MKRPFSRRMFLRGVGGATLALPFLSSITTRAFAQEVPLSIGSRFFYLRTGHGDVWGANMYPQETVLTQSIEYSGRSVRYGVLPRQPINDENIIHWSPVCRARTDYITPEVASKINILRGIDVPYSIGHQAGVNLGNLGASAIGVPLGVRKSYATPTIDQAMAYSSHFYSQNELSTRVLRRSFSINGRLSFGYSQPSTQSGAIIATQAFTSSQQLYDYLFNGAASLSGWNTSMLNRVYTEYRRLLRHPRLSTGDRIRLEQHMERMADLERLLGVSEALDGNIPHGPGALGDSQAYHRNNQLRFAEMYVDAYIEVIVAAFTTGVCRVGTWNIGDTFFTDQEASLAYPGGVWHEQVAHGGLGAERSQAYTVVYNQGTFEHIFAKLAKALNDVTMEDGQTALDHCLLVFGQEHGQITHHTQNCKTFPVVTAGSAGRRVSGA